MVKDEQEWCMDVFDHFVLAGQSVTVGEAVVRRYRPVSAENDHIVLHIFASDKDDCKVKKIQYYPKLLLWNFLKETTYLNRPFSINILSCCVKAISIFIQLCMCQTMPCNLFFNLASCSPKLISKLN